MSRVNRDQYFLKIAKQASKRSTCPRRKVGCVLTYNNRVIAIGYNSAPSGISHCEDVGCLKFGENCIRTVHAEVSALSVMSINKMYIDPIRLCCYLTDKPCGNCFKTLISFGFRKIIYLREYKDLITEALEKSYKVECIKMKL